MFTKKTCPQFRTAATKSNRFFVILLISLIGNLVCISELSAQETQADSDLDKSQVNNPQELTIRPYELQSLGCLTAGIGISGATILLSGTSMLFLGGQGAATAGVVAVPVLIAAAAVGCSFGSQVAPGIAWLYKNKYLEPWEMFSKIRIPKYF
ncbi:membrane hypothetical protein [Gammaproteobacteria bacterium]